MKMWAVAGVFLLVAIIVSASLITGLISLGTWDFSGSDTKPDTNLSVPELISPSDGAESFNKNITLSWTGAQNALNYELMVGNSPSFGNPIKEVVVNGSSYSIYLNDGLYYWKVMAIGERSVSNWTPIKSFEIRTALGVSELRSPSNNGIVTSPNQTYKWTEVTQASFYRLQVDDNDDFSSPSIDILVNGTVYPCAYHYANGRTYHWRIMALNQSIDSAWTVPSSFSVSIALSSPSLLTPSNGAIIYSADMILNWTDIPGAIVYHFQISNSIDFTTPTVDALVQPSYYDTSSLRSNTTYYWRVMASNDNYQSKWSPASSFFIGIHYFLKSYSWSYQGHAFSFDLNISGPSYYQKRVLNMNSTDPYTQIDYASHVASSDPALNQAAQAIRNMAISRGYDSEDTLNLALAFVQTPNIRYDEDQNTTGHIDYARYPIETLVDKVGDCDCKSILFLSLIQTAALNYNGVLLEYLGNPGHMAVGVAGYFDDYITAFTYTSYQYLGQKYYYCETTGSGMVGQIPPGYSSAMIIPA
jgi:hypothetical protein